MRNHRLRLGQTLQQVKLVPSEAEGLLKGTSRGLNCGIPLCLVDIELPKNMCQRLEGVISPTIPRLVMRRRRSVDDCVQRISESGRAGQRPGIESSDGTDVKRPESRVRERR
jgi:hypothetical protein